MAQKVFRTGNSLAVTIPAPFVESLGVKAGDKVEVVVSPSKGRLTVKFSGACQLPLSENFFTRKKR